MVKRVKEMDGRADALRDEARKRVQAAPGLSEAPKYGSDHYQEWDDRLERDPAWQAEEYNHWTAEDTRRIALHYAG